jgi:hypothetical protein
MTRKKGPNKTPHVIRIDDEDWQLLQDESDSISIREKSIITGSELVRRAVANYCNVLRERLGHADIT